MLKLDNMTIAINTEPLMTGYRTQGTGIYTQQLVKALKEYFKENTYREFSRKQKLVGDNLDVIHYPYFNPFFLTLPLYKRYPTVVTVHDLIPLVFPKHFPVGFKGRLKWEIQKWSLQNASAIIADSESSKNDIIKFTGINKERIHVIYLAARKEFKKTNRKSKKVEEMRKKYNLPGEFVLYVGDIIWSKNIPTLIKAIKKVKIPLVMVGKQTTAKDFDRYNLWNKDLVLFAKLVEGDKNILRLGFIPNEDLVAIFNLATVFVMPSIYEGFGLPILEAMSCGCPVVTTREGSLSEVAGEGAYYVDPYDINSIADGIVAVYFNKSIQNKLSEEGLEQIKKFSWRKTAEKTLDIYKNVLC